MLIFHRFSLCSVLSLAAFLYMVTQGSGNFPQRETNGPKSYRKERVKLYGQAFP